jgi:hypothetical protein
VAAGPAVYLVAHTLFGYRLTGSLTKRKVVATLACVAFGFVGLFVPALVLAGLLVVVLAALIVSNYLLPSPAGATGEAFPTEQPEASTVGRNPESRVHRTE